MAKSSDIVSQALPYAIPALGLYLVYKYFTKESEQKQEQDEAVKAVTGVPTKDGSTKSNISVTDASSKANFLYGEMQGFGSGFSAMLATLQGVNGKGLQLIFQKFGTHPYLIAGYWPEAAGGVPLDLFGWFLNELDLDELNQMRQVWNKSGLSL